MTARHLSVAFFLGLCFTGVTGLVGCGTVAVAADAAIGGDPDASAPADSRVAGADAGAPDAPDAGDAICGDGRREAEEECDDGNDDDSDGCTAACLEARTIGCADGRRDGYLDLSAYPDISACAGAWTAPGLAQPRTGCDGGGDDDPTPGQGCAAVDLCADGWHLCASAAEVAERTGETGCGAAVDGSDELFFATLQGSSGSGLCDGGGENDLFGCGSIGAVPAAGCAPLDRFSGDTCTSLPAPWQCPDSYHELANATKATAAGGGVLCCRD